LRPTVRICVARDHVLSGTPSARPRKDFLTHDSAVATGMANFNHSALVWPLLIALFDKAQSLSCDKGPLPVSSSGRSETMQSLPSSPGNKNKIPNELFLTAAIPGIGRSVG
jgi:hypothetical protein